MRTNRIWVVEVLHDSASYLGWRATVGVGLTREEARKEMVVWKRRNPCDRFRLCRYSS